MVKEGQSGTAARERSDSARMKVLWVLPRPLEPLDTGGKIRTWNTLRYLARQHDITVIGLQPKLEGVVHALVPAKGRELFHSLIPVPWSEPVKGSPRFWLKVLANLLSPHSFVMAKYRNSVLEQRIRQLVASERYDIVVADFLHITRSVPETGVPRVVFQHNVEAQIRQRHYRDHGWGITRAFLAWEWLRMDRWERKICREYDGVIAVSEEDAAWFRDRCGAKRVWTVPTGVDETYFTPDGDRTKPGWDLVFSGSMDWEANSLGMRWFLEDVLPLIRRLRPGTAVGVIGRNPPDWLRALADETGGVTVTGRVEDIRPYVRSGLLYIVPIRFGGGTRIKIFEAMAMGLPVVSTPIGAEGLQLRDGRHIALAERPEDFSAAVLRLLDDRSAAEEMARTAREHVLHSNSWSRVAEIFGDALASAKAAGR
jgi:glycosyltransferase involved in cell wall biosynthesis